MDSLRKNHADSIGQCATCTHTRIIRSDRGSAFYQCGRSFRDTVYPKYPRLPVLNCAGYEKRADSNTK